MSSQNPIERVAAGFAIPALKNNRKPLDIGRLLMINPYSTYFMRVQGSSLRYYGVFSGDILVIDRSLAPSRGHIIVASQEGELTVCQLSGELQSPINYWGRATYVIHGLN